MAVDTLALARELRAVDSPQPQADAIAAAIGRSIGEGSASKADIGLVLQRLSSLESNFDAKSESLEQRLSAKIETVRSSLLTWVIGALIGSVGVVVAILRFPALQ